MFCPWLRLPTRKIRNKIAGSVVPITPCGLNEVPATPETVRNLYACHRDDNPFEAYRGGSEKCFRVALAWYANGPLAAKGKRVRGLSRLPPRQGLEATDLKGGKGEAMGEWLTKE